jgi:hypothetical protein
MHRRFDLTALGHPVWWGALALLLVNDHLFKGRGVVPGWLTGKLSDFAFLIVAPVVLAALIPRRVPRRRTIAVAAVVAVYAAADLSRAASDTIVALAARVGLSWRLWPDPTDLLALAVLPITIWLLRRAPRPAARVARPAVGQRERAGVMLGALACLATSAVHPDFHNAFLVNRMGGAADVRVTWVLRQVDCATTPEALGPLLTPGDLDDPRPMTMQSGDVAALNGPASPSLSPVGLCTNAEPSIFLRQNPSDCVAAILETDGATPVLMVAPSWWVEGDTSDFVCAPRLDPQRSPGRDGLSLVDSGGARRFELAGSGPGGQLPASSPIRIAPIDPAAVAARPSPADSCRATLDAYRALASMRSCARDSDCQALSAQWIPSLGPGCGFSVNTTVSPEAIVMLEMQWNSALCRGRTNSPCEAGRSMTGAGGPVCIEATCQGDR